MGFEFSLNYFIFSIFLTMFSLEVGIALTMLLEYKKYKDRMKKFLMPLWEITGTFAIFYIVNFEASFPSLLILVGSAYVLPLLISAMFFIFRNAFLAYSEYVGDKKTEKTYLRIYSIATLVVAFVAISVLDSGVSGVGINLQSVGIDALSLFVNSFNMLMFLGMALLAFFVAAVFFSIQGYKWLTGAAAVVGVICVAIATYSKISYLFDKAVGIGLPYFLSLLVLLGFTIYAHYSGKRYAKYAAVIWFLLGVNFFGFMQQPFVFGGAVDTSAYLPSGSSAVDIGVVTLIGGATLAASLAYFIYITYFKKDEIKEIKENEY